MKAGIAVPLFSSLLSLFAIVAIPSLARSSSSGSTTTTTAPAGNSASDQPGTAATTSNTTNENGAGSWQRSAVGAAHNGEVAVENAYNHVARDVKDMWLAGRVMGVLHENKLTRDSGVQVTAENGVVTLTGRVPSELNANRVLEVVASVYGVKAVNNDLKYPRGRGASIAPDADSMGTAHPAYSDTAPAENAPTR